MNERAQPIKTKPNLTIRRHICYFITFGYYHIKQYCLIIWFFTNVKQKLRPSQVKVKYNAKIYNKINSEKCNEISINCCHFLFKEYSTFDRHMPCNVFLDEHFDKTPAYNKCFCQVTNLVEIKNVILEVNLQRFTDFLLAGADFQSSKNPLSGPTLET